MMDTHPDLSWLSPLNHHHQQQQQQDQQEQFAAAPEQAAAAAAAQRCSTPPASASRQPVDCMLSPTRPRHAARPLASDLLLPHLWESSSSAGLGEPLVADPMLPTPTQPWPTLAEAQEAEAPTLPSQAAPTHTSALDWQPFGLGSAVNTDPAATTLPFGSPANTAVVTVAPAATTPAGTGEQDTDSVATAAAAAAHTSLASGSAAPAPGSAAAAAPPATLSTTRTPASNTGGDGEPQALPASLTLPPNPQPGGIGEPQPAPTVAAAPAPAPAPASASRFALHGAFLASFPSRLLGIGYAILDASPVPSSAEELRVHLVRADAEAGGAGGRFGASLYAPHGIFLARAPALFSGAGYELLEAAPLPAAEISVLLRRIPGAETRRVAAQPAGSSSSSSSAPATSFRVPQTLLSTRYAAM